MTGRDWRLLRYLAAGGAVLVGVLVAAAVTNRVGNTLATVLIGVGLLAFLVFLGRDLGMLDAGGSRPHRPPPAAHAPESRNGSEPDASEARRAYEPPDAWSDPPEADPRP